MSPTARIGAAGLVVALAAGLVAPATAAQPTDRRAPRPMLASAKDDVVVGQKLVLKGAVAPATKGTTVILQKRVGEKKWVEEARLKTNHNGGFAYRDKPHVAGERSYRAVVPGRGKSKPVTVTVYRWQSLTKVQGRSGENTWTSDTASIGGKKYAPVVQGPWIPSGVRGAMDWNIGRTCLRLRTTVGNGDNADTGSVASITISGDGKALYAHDFALTESADSTLDLTGVFRLAFSWSASNPSTGATGGAQALLAEPEVLCAF